MVSALDGRENWFYVAHNVGANGCVVWWIEMLFALVWREQLFDLGLNLAPHPKPPSSRRALECVWWSCDLPRPGNGNLYVRCIGCDWAALMTNHFRLNWEHCSLFKFLNLIPIIFHLITLSEISGGRGNETTCFYGIIHQELIEAFIQFSADKTV